MRMEREGFTGHSARKRLSVDVYKRQVRGQAVNKGCPHSVGRLLSKKDGQGAHILSVFR